MVSLSLDEVGAAYGRRRVLSGVSVGPLRGGEVTAVIGPNAAGKSTLFKRILGHVAGDGHVRLEAVRPPRDAIVYMPQDFSAKAALSVYESIILAAKQNDSGWHVSDAKLMRVENIMASLRISELAFRGLGELSGGQRQLVSIAQALVRDPEVLLMDEPTSALDLSRQVEVLAHMHHLAKSKELLVLIALHDLNHVLRYCDQVIVIADGTMVAAGPVEKVVTEELLSRVYGVRARLEICSEKRPFLIIDGLSGPSPSA
ncbi:ABC transporter ATP-binding protein [Afifella marina]|uniref:Iron complex transport system ATP-binding protein n=1 Tax=Afifella marina DSM 2698 TaxID=1120955 RepID=A0A1G5NV97_AFIMA|nr:ABC transporter ATP-binding protein [Afifella marina]MBK1624152.1 ABC transporter ATP-binding protein [Afifella marina DSM 2698]MBK1627709.1 ABC transporter ATP-binding protein [Afifella marina]MBK5916433.1 ferrichrome ABC transporter [Afifella marina]RAI20985.1 ferrichrome ABC transporter [Afifella marina DSM 2698]SCZ40640.1 iron complex transport system ATP-binding protein [Afifella marina DSM 2698]